MSWEEREEKKKIREMKKKKQGEGQMRIESRKIRHVSWEERDKDLRNEEETDGKKIKKNRISKK